MPTSWEDYLGAPAAKSAYGACRTRCGDAFDPVRRILERAIAAREPRSVACLGAGVLNDIPFRELVLSGAELHLVDWVPGVVETGIGQSIIARDEDGNPECAFCMLGEQGALPWCRKFTGPGTGIPGVCGNYDGAGNAPPVCRSYLRGEQPGVLCEDVTGGYATAFAGAAFEAAATANSWRQALRQASAAAKRARRHRTALGIADNSIDLVTSSMLMSQFEHEPYTYFSRQVASRLGAPTAQDERKLRHPLESLQNDLLRNQVEAHCEEIKRILAPAGRLFAAFELFHYDAGNESWFLVREMHAALEILARHFDFDYTSLSVGDCVTEISIGDSPSVVQAFLLRPKAA